MVGFYLTLLICLPPPLEDARQIVAKMEAVYAALESYRDSGEGEKVVCTKGEDTERDRLTFSTAFQRPGRIRFEYEGPWGTGKDRKPSWSMLLASKGEKELFRFRIRLTRSPDQVTAYVASTFGRENGSVKNYGRMPLDLAVAGFGGLSWGTSCMVPTMLMPDDIISLRFSQMPELELLGEETLDGRTCFRLASTSVPFKTKTTFWVDKALHLLRKTQRVSEMEPRDPTESPTTITTVITYRPEANAKIPEELFVPPGSNRCP